jgi:hypothetical protein
LWRFLLFYTVKGGGMILFVEKLSSKFCKKKKKSKGNNIWVLWLKMVEIIILE